MVVHAFVTSTLATRELLNVTDRQIQKWCRNPSLRASAFDDGSGSLWLFELDDPSGRTQRVLVSKLVHMALDQFNEPRRIDEVLTELRARGWTEPGLQRLETALLEQCVSKNILVPDNASELLAPMQPKRPRYLSLMLQLLPPAVVNSVARRLAWLFTPRAIIVGLAVIAAGQIALIDALLKPAQVAVITSTNVLLILGLGLAIVLLHELGHATAAWRGGARQVGIGVGWYVCFPVAYADLSEIWRLPRRQRALIDVAGIYMQGLAVAALMLVNYWYPSAGFLALSVAVTISILWNMNPLLRMDGYWFLSDLLGAPNLRADAMAALRGIWRRWRGLPADPAKRAMSPRFALFVSGYAIACSVFLIVLLGGALVHFRHGLFVEAPQHARRLLQTDLGSLGWADSIVLIGSLAWKILLLGLLGRYLIKLSYGLLAGTVAWLHERWRIAHKRDSAPSKVAK